MDNLLNAYSEYLELGEDFRLDKVEMEAYILDVDTRVNFCKFLVLTREFIIESQVNRFENVISVLTPDINF